MKKLFLAVLLACGILQASEGPSPRVFDALLGTLPVSELSAEELGELYGIDPNFTVDEMVTPMFEEEFGSEEDDEVEDTLDHYPGMGKLDDRYLVDVREELSEDEEPQDTLYEGGEDSLMQALGLSDEEEDLIDNVVSEEKQNPTLMDLILYSEDAQPDDPYFIWLMNEKGVSPHATVFPSRQEYEEEMRKKKEAQELEEFENLEAQAQREEEHENFLAAAERDPRIIKLAARQLQESLLRTKKQKRFDKLRRSHGDHVSNDELWQQVLAEFPPTLNIDIDAAIQQLVKDPKTELPAHVTALLFPQEELVRPIDMRQFETAEGALVTGEELRRSEKEGKVIALKDPSTPPVFKREQSVQEEPYDPVAELEREWNYLDRISKPAVDYDERVYAPIRRRIVDAQNAPAPAVPEWFNKTYETVDGALISGREIQRLQREGRSLPIIKDREDMPRVDVPQPQPYPVRWESPFDVQQQTFEDALLAASTDSESDEGFVPSVSGDVQAVEEDRYAAIAELDAQRRLEMDSPAVSDASTEYLELPFPKEQETRITQQQELLLLEVNQKLQTVLEGLVYFDESVNAGPEIFMMVNPSLKDIAFECVQLARYPDLIEKYLNETEQAVEPLEQVWFDNPAFVRVLTEDYDMEISEDHGVKRAVPRPIMAILDNAITKYEEYRGRFLYGFASLLQEGVYEEIKELIARQDRVQALLAKGTKYRTKADLDALTGVIERIDNRFDELWAEVVQNAKSILQEQENRQNEIKPTGIPVPSTQRGTARNSERAGSRQLQSHFEEKIKISKGEKVDFIERSLADQLATEEFEALERQVQEKARQKARRGRKHRRGQTLGGNRDFNALRRQLSVIPEEDEGE